jgi:hypothetical protein
VPAAALYAVLDELRQDAGVSPGDVQEEGGAMSELTRSGQKEPIPTFTREEKARIIAVAIDRYVATVAQPRVDLRQGEAQEALERMARELVEVMHR